VSDVIAQDEKSNSIPLDHFYVDRQGPSTFRRILSKITFGFSTGYGRTNFYQKIEKGYGILQNVDSMPRLFRPDPAAVSSNYNNWFNKSDSSNNAVLPGAFLVNSDTTKLAFRNKAFNIPLRATLHVEIKQRYRVGLGYSFEYTNLSTFKPVYYGDRIASYSPEVSSFFLKKYFLILGGAVYRYYDYLLVVDANIGGYKLGKKFDNSNIKKGIFFNIGATVERDMSEYFKLFVRPSYEFKGYNLGMPHGDPAIRHRMNAFYINVGATYRFPELRRCFLKTCKIQMNHAHGNREYRSRVHPIYKKQNPHYGENHPDLIKYKGKNKKRLNPY
jgi:hypothetical protein